MTRVVREIMTESAEYVREDETVLGAAQKMKRLDVGALPICGEDDRLKGVVTDRDIVVKVVADGKNPAETKVGELAQGKPVTVGADDSIEEALKTMAEHKVRRLPVIDGHKLVGIVSQGDLATELGSEKVGELVGAISSR